VPEGLLVDGTNFYFSEFPPGQAVSKVGLPATDTLGDFLNNMGATSGSTNGASTRPGTGPGPGN